MAKQLFDDLRRCRVCGTTKDLHRHHIIYGNGRRSQSEKWGCTCYLCGRHHNMSNDGVHFNKELDLKLKRECELWCLRTYGWSIEDFIKEFRRNYL